VGRRAVRLVAPLLAVEVGGSVPAATLRRLLVIPRTKALERSPRLQERAVGREVLLRKQPLLTGLAYRRPQERLGDLVPEEPLPVVAEGCGVEGPVGDVEPEEPLEEQVVLEALTELPFGADGVERHQQGRL